jgi:hypothetical protein
VGVGLAERLRLGVCGPAAFGRRVYQSRMSHCGGLRNVRFGAKVTVKLPSLYPNGREETRSYPFRRLAYRTSDRVVAR